jgi:hypothetical protein
VLRQNWRKPSPPVLRPNQRKPSPPVLRLNQKTCATRLHMHGAGCTRCYPTSRSSGHRVPDLCDHPRSSAPGLLLLPRSSSLFVMPHLPHAYHKTSKRDSSHDTKIKVKLPKCPVFEFKPHQVNDSSHSNQGTDHLVYQSPLDESIDNKRHKL